MVGKRCFTNIMHIVHVVPYTYIVTKHLHTYVAASAPLLQCTYIHCMYMYVHKYSRKVKSVATSKQY